MLLFLLHLFEFDLGLLSLEEGVLLVLGQLVGRQERPARDVQRGGLSGRPSG